MLKSGVIVMLGGNKMSAKEKKIIRIVCLVLAIVSVLGVCISLIRF